MKYNVVLKISSTNNLYRTRVLFNLAEQLYSIADNKNEIMEYARQLNNNMKERLRL